MNQKDPITTPNSICPSASSSDGADALEQLRAASRRIRERGAQAISQSVNPTLSDAYNQSSRQVNGQ